MANKILTIVFDTTEESLDSIIAAAVNEITALGHNLKQIRLADDSGEAIIPPNTVEGVVPPEEPAPAEPETPAADEPAPSDTPVTVPTEAPEDVPADEPVDPTEASSTESSTTSA